MAPNPGAVSGAWRPGSRPATQGLDIRYVVTNLEGGSAEWLYDTLYCARGQAENLIKLHKSQLASDRTSCRSALANQVRLVLHTAAYWLMLTVRDAIPNRTRWRAPNSPPCGCACSRSQGASPRPRRACASPSPQPAQKRRCSGASRSASSPPDHDTRGDRPALTRSRQPQRPHD